MTDDTICGRMGVMDSQRIIVARDAVAGDTRIEVYTCSGSAGMTDYALHS